MSSLRSGPCNLFRDFKFYRQGRNRTAVIIIVGSSDGEDRLYDNLEEHLVRNLQLEEISKDSSFYESVCASINSCQLFLLVFNAAYRSEFSVPLDNVLRLTMNRCLELRRRMAHLIKNYKSSSTISTETQLLQSLPTRMVKMLRQHDLETQAMDSLVACLNDEGSDASFSSPGESFAWQLATGFLSYILPKLQTEIRSSLLDSEGLIRQQVLTDFGITDVNPKNVLVVPKYHLLLDERILFDHQSVSCACPQLLFPECTKVSNASTELFLEFDSPGYKKRVPAYLMKLEKPLSKDQVTYTHSVIFGGFAAPMFVMQKLQSISDEDKKTMFQQFRDELMFIQSHPRANAILREFSDCGSEEVTESEPGALHVIDIGEDENSLRSSISASIEDFLLLDGWRIVSKQSEHLSRSESVHDDVPPMSMAFAMAANTWIGFAQLLNDHIEHLSSTAEQIPFDLPYLFVIPKSGRYPDEAKLHSRFAELGVQTSVREFRVSSGRRYTFRVHEWRSRRLAFEIPNCVLNIRKQAECCVGGISDGDLGAHLAEYRDSLNQFASAEGGDRFKVVEFDDIAGFDESSRMEPSCEFAQSLISLLSKNIAHND